MKEAQCLLPRRWLLASRLSNHSSSGGRKVAKNPLKLCSVGSLLSIASEGSILSIGSVGSVLSIGSIGSACSVLSIGSAGSAASVLSFASKRSLLSAGSVDSVHDVPMGPRQRKAVGIGLLALGAVLLRG